MLRIVIGLVCVFRVIHAIGGWPGLPNAVAVLDSTSHGTYRTKTEPQEQFDSGHRLMHCIQTQLKIDNQNHIRVVRSGFLGHQNDAQQINSMPDIGYGLQLDFPENLFIVADKIYANRYQLMTPYKRHQLRHKTRRDRDQCKKQNSRIGECKVNVEHAICRLIKCYKVLGTMWRHPRWRITQIIELCAGDIEHVCTADNPIYPCEYPLPCQEQKCAKFPAAKCYMDREDRRRYFIVGSVILEVVTPLLWKRIEHDYTNSGLASLQDFLNKKSTIHIIFHLRHRNTWCCRDKTNCSNNGALPLNYCQWDLLYTETNTGVNPHGCQCKFSANPVQLDNLDITLASLILLNCCILTPGEKTAIQKLRQYKNDYLSHNIKGAITKGEYKTLWADLTNCILQLDPCKQD
ncbi:unnamed protein product [Mytilus edulis]|uniref:DDE Tnp4 domain-containing protein n=1 Tax=Mytilus edulis TaxID=6550 RepID=A0A8S3PRW9_MYTED|nr:unnamed protein product [Mytilus edulis]